ncbi:MAG: aminotransferase class I/II-fold pyridoxal phosphate-dependent enzyme [Fimbriimonadaceae bacterium]|nr:aminotransferase class I/II-fold pyridoxal phosphate-dependent enzyme [Fimbriimonadaceae bacterium]
MPISRLVRDLPSTVPFVGPEALERAQGFPFALRLGANESPFGPAPEAIAAMRSATEESWMYADPEGWELRTALALRLGVGVGNLVLGAGIDDLLGLAVRVFCDPGDACATSLGGYPTFAYHVAGYGARLVTAPYRATATPGHGCTDLSALAEVAHDERARLVYVANPDNPSGTWHEAETVREFRDALPDDAVLLLDEAYAEFMESPSPTWHPEDEGVVRFRTFSKVHGLAGARIGYAVMPASIAREFEKVRLHFGINRVAMAGALASLASDHAARVVEETAIGRARLVAELGARGYVCLPSATNFVGLGAGSRERAEAIVAGLRARGVFVRKPAHPPLDGHVRVTVGTAPQIEAFLAAFDDLRA